MYVALIAYFVLCIVYYVQRKYVFFRKGEIAVFDRRIQNLSPATPCIYSIQNANIAHKRFTQNNVLQFPIFAERTVDEHRVQFLLHITATVDFINSEKHMTDPQERSMQEIASAVGAFLCNCETTASYLLFGDEFNSNAWEEFNKQFLHTHIHHMKVRIADARAISPHVPQLDTTQDLTPINPSIEESNI